MRTPGRGRADPGLARAWGGVRPHARGYAARSRIPGRASSVRSSSVLRSPLARLAVCVPGSGVLGVVLPRRDRASEAVTVPAQDPFPRSGVVGDVLPGPAPLHAVRVPQGDAPSLRSVTLPAWPLPAFRSAAWSVVPPLRAGDGPPLRGSRVQAFSPLATGLLMPRARGRARGTPSPPLAPSDSAPGWTPGLARCGAGPRRLCVARWPRAPLPPSAGGRSAGVRAERLDARRRSCAGRPLPLLRSCLPPPLRCRLRRFMLLACRSFHHLHRLTAAVAAVVRRLPAAPASGCSESESGRASSPLSSGPYVCKPRSRLRPGHAVARASQRTAKPVPGPPGSPRAPARSGRPVLAGRCEETSALRRGRGASGGVAVCHFQTVFNHSTVLEMSTFSAKSTSSGIRFTPSNGITMFAGKTGASRK